MYIVVICVILQVAHCGVHLVCFISNAYKQQILEKYKQLNPFTLNQLSNSWEFAKQLKFHS